jgi:hypothetical protein
MIRERRDTDASDFHPSLGRVTCDSVANDIPRATSSNEVIDTCLLARSNQGDRARLLTENEAGSIPAVPANPLPIIRARGGVATQRIATPRTPVRFRACSPSGYSSVVEHHVANVETRVRFPISAPNSRAWSTGWASAFQAEEAGSSPAARSRSPSSMGRTVDFHSAKTGSSPVGGTN